MNKLGKDEDHLSQYNQVGNAVPPLLAKAIADHVREFLDIQNIHLNAAEVQHKLHHATI
jgi:hypothetical protein